MQNSNLNRISKKIGIILVIIYARVSDIKQLENESLETQVYKCTEYALSKGWLIVKVFQEQHTGTEYRERKLLSEAREMIRNGEADVLLVNSLDRLSREMIHQAVIMDEIEHYSATLESVTEDIDNSPLGQFMRQALGFAAAVEREKFLERSKRSIDKRVRDRKLIGGGFATYGYTFNEDHSRYLLHPEESKIVERMFDLRIEGYPIRRIAIILNQEGIRTRKNGKWSTATVYHMLHNPIYTGLAQAYRIKRIKEEGKIRQVQHPGTVDLPEGTIPPIISKEKFNTVQTLLENAKVDSSRNNQNHELFLLRTGYIKCGYCGRTMTVARLIERPSKVDPNKMICFNRPRYRCTAFSKAVVNCKGCSIVTETIDTIVWEYIGSILNDLTEVKQALNLIKGKQKQQHDVEAIERSIENAKKEQEQYSEDMKGLRGNARNAILNQINTLEDKIEQLEKEKAQAIPQATNIERQQQEIDKFLAWAEKMKGRYHEATYEEKRTALKVLGIGVSLYSPQDKEHEQYEIKVGLTEIVSTHHTLLKRA